MNGAELGPPELAYLLAALEAEQVIGLRAPDLFPEEAEAKEAAYSQGRKDLETHGWIFPIPRHKDEYELNPILFELVSIIADPEFVLATILESEKGDKGLLLHYVAQGRIAELAATRNGHYVIGLVPDFERLIKGLADRLGASNPDPSPRFDLPKTTFDKVVGAIREGKPAAAKQVLEAAGVQASEVNWILGESTSKLQVEIVLIHVRDGEVEGGRRVAALGQGKTAWMTYRSRTEGGILSFSNCDEFSLGALISEWIADLRKPGESKS
jgi:hypothetical protein